MNRPGRLSSETGASLIVVLAVTVAAALLSAAVLAYAMTSMRSADAHRTRTERMLALSGAMDLTIHDARLEMGKGRYGTAGSSFHHDEAGITVTCEGLPAEGDEPASGAELPDGQRADRRVRCVAVEGSGSEPDLEQVVLIHDGGGSDPGSGVEVITEVRPS